MTASPPLSKESLKFRFPDVAETVLDDGTPLYVIEKAGEDVATFGIYLRAGSAHDVRAGATAFAAEMLTRGTVDRAAEEFDEIVEGLGSSIRSTCDRDTSSVYGVSLNEHFEETTRLAAECLLRPAFGDREMNTMRQQFITEAQIDEKDPEWLATQASNRVCYRGHPYERRRRGTIADMSSMMQADLITAHQRFLSAPRCIIVAGSVNTNEMRAMFNELLEGMPPVKFNPALSRAQLSENSGCLAVNAEAVQTAFRISMPGVELDNADYPALQLITGTLGGYTLARLFSVLREQKGYTYGAYAMSSVRPWAQTIDIVTSVGNEFTADTLQTIADEVSRIASERIRIEELENTRQYILGTFARTNETPQQTAGLLWTTLLHGLPRDFFQEHIVRIQRLTPDDLLPVQMRYFDKSRWAIGASGIEDVVLPALKMHVHEVETMHI
ncbi:MAG: insulinase family protein [Ignavibacteria bacterium]|nr:insulinase family protein [Ignavibacteria bacterium]